MHQHLYRIRNPEYSKHVARGPAPFASPRAHGDAVSGLVPDLLTRRWFTGALEALAGNNAWSIVSALWLLAAISVLIFIPSNPAAHPQGRKPRREKPTAPAPTDRRRQNSRAEKVREQPAVPGRRGLSVLWSGWPRKTGVVLVIRLKCRKLQIPGAWAAEGHSIIATSIFQIVAEHKCQKPYHLKRTIQWQ